MKSFIKKSDVDAACFFKHAKYFFESARHFFVSALFLVSILFVSCTKVRFVVESDSELKEFALQFEEAQGDNPNTKTYDICTARLSLIIQNNDDENVSSAAVENGLLEQTNFNENHSQKASVSDESSESDTLSRIFKKEIFREPLYPCIAFKEDYNDEDFTSAAMYIFSEIPEGFIALKANGMYADNPEYPFWQKTYVQLELPSLPDEKTLSQNKVRLSKKQKETFIQKQQSLFTWFEETDFLQAFNQKQKALCSGSDDTDFLQNAGSDTQLVPSVVFVAAVGDIMLARGVQDLMLSKKSAEVVFTDTMPVLVNNDFTIGNLEGVVTDRNLKTPKTYNFKFNKKALPYLSQAGFDYLMLTNNHSYDYGEDGFKDTLAAVKNAGFATSGAGMNDTEAEQFFTTEIKGHTVSVISAGGFPVERSGFNGQKQASATHERAGILWKGDRLLELVREQKKISDIVIVNMHAGTEYSKIPNKTQTEFYKVLCENGADVVFGSHPHVLQPVEWYGNSLIVWSLGNYVFPGMEEMPGGTDTMIIRTGFVNGRLLYYEKYPAKIDGRCVRLK